MKTTLQNSMTKAEREVDAAETLTSKFKNIETDIAEKRHRIKLVTAEIKAAQFEQHLGEKSNRTRGLEVEIAALDSEMTNLNMQGTHRAKLDIDRNNLTKIESEIANVSVYFLYFLGHFILTRFVASLSTIRHSGPWWETMLGLRLWSGI